MTYYYRNLAQGYYRVEIRLRVGAYVHRKNHVQKLERSVQPFEVSKSMSDTLSLKRQICTGTGF